MNQLNIIQPIIEDFLIENQINYAINEERDKERNIIHMGFNLENGIVNTYIIIHYSIQIVEIFTYLPIQVPEIKRLQVAKLLDMIESNYFFGSLELNHNNGTVRSKSYFIYDENRVSHNTIDLHFSIVNQLANETFPEIIKICYTNNEPEIDLLTSLKKINLN